MSCIHTSYTYLLSLNLNHDRLKAMRFGRSKYKADMSSDQHHYGQYDSEGYNSGGLAVGRLARVSSVSNSYKYTISVWCKYSIRITVNMYSQHIPIILYIYIYVLLIIYTLLYLYNMHVNIV